MNENIFVKIIGYPAIIFHGDTAVFDRWLWLRKYIQKGNLKTLDAGCGSGAFAFYAAKKATTFWEFLLTSGIIRKPRKGQKF